MRSIPQLIPVYRTFDMEFKRICPNDLLWQNEDHLRVHTAIIVCIKRDAARNCRQRPFRCLELQIFTLRRP